MKNNNDTSASEATSKNTNQASEPYAQLLCADCEALWDIDFTKKKEHPAEYVVAIEQKIGDGCPDCHGELVLVGDKL